MRDEDLQYKLDRLEEDNSNINFLLLLLILGPLGGGIGAGIAYFFGILGIIGLAVASYFLVLYSLSFILTSLEIIIKKISRYIPVILYTLTVFIVFLSPFFLMAIETGMIEFDMSAFKRNLWHGCLLLVGGVMFATCYALLYKAMEKLDNLFSGKK